MMKNGPVFPQGEAGNQVQVSMQGDTTSEDIKADLDKKPEEAWGKSLDSVIASFAWMPGNLFIGPINTQRMDDPDEEFEQYAEGPAGDWWPMVSTANAAIDTYLSAQSTANAMIAIKALMVIAERTDFLPYKPEDWEEPTFLKADDFNFGDTPAGDRDQLFLNVAQGPGKRYLFKLVATPPTDVQGAKLSAYKANIQSLIDKYIAAERKRIEDARKPPPVRKSGDSEEDDSDLGDLFG